MHRDSLPTQEGALAMQGTEGDTGRGRCRRERRLGAADRADVTAGAQDADVDPPPRPASRRAVASRPTSRGASSGSSLPSGRGGVMRSPPPPACSETWPKGGDQPGGGERTPRCQEIWVAHFGTVTGVDAGAVVKPLGVP